MSLNQGSTVPKLLENNFPNGSQYKILKPINVKSINQAIQWNLDLVTLLVSQKTVTKSRVVTKSIAHAYGLSINSKLSLGNNSDFYC